MGTSVSLVHLLGACPEGCMRPAPSRACLPPLRKSWYGRCSDATRGRYGTPTAIEQRRAPGFVPWRSVTGLPMPCELRLLPFDDDPVDDEIGVVIVDCGDNAWL